MQSRGDVAERFLRICKKYWMHAKYAEISIQELKKTGPQRTERSASLGRELLYQKCRRSSAAKALCKLGESLARQMELCNLDSSIVLQFLERVRGEDAGARKANKIWETVKVSIQRLRLVMVEEPYATKTSIIGANAIANQAVPATISAQVADKSADTSNKKKLVVPRNVEVLKLAIEIKAEKSKGRSKEDVAIEFTNGDQTKAESLLRSLRRYPDLLGPPDK